MERVKLRHKQVRNVLPTDSLEQLDEDLNGVAKALKPENRIIQIYSDDFAYSSWEVGRYRRGCSPSALIHADARAAAVVIDKLDSSSFQREANCFDGPAP